MQGTHGKRLLRQLPPNLIDRAREYWTHSLVPQTSESSFHTEVYRHLTMMNMQPRSEVRTEDGLFSIDIAVMYKGHNVALEAMGPSHFTANSVQVNGRIGKALLGPDMLRVKLLQLRGWAVLCIPYWIKTTAVNKAEFRKWVQKELDACAQRMGRQAGRVGRNQRHGTNIKSGGIALHTVVYEVDEHAGVPGSGHQGKHGYKNSAHVRNDRQLQDSSASPARPFSRQLSEADTSEFDLDLVLEDLTESDS